MILTQNLNVDLGGYRSTDSVAGRANVQTAFVLIHGIDEQWIGDVLFFAYNLRWENKQDLWGFDELSSEMFE